MWLSRQDEHLHPKMRASPHGKRSKRKVAFAPMPLKVSQTSQGTVRKDKASATERDFPHIVEIELPTNGLDDRMNREIMTFHRLRDIQLRFGRRKTQTSKQYSRWCFSDPTIADAFREQFGGERVTNSP